MSDRSDSLDSIKSMLREGNAPLNRMVLDAIDALEKELALSEKAIVEGYTIYRHGFVLIREALTFSGAARTARDSMSGAPGGGWDIHAWEQRARRYLKETDIESASSAGESPK